MDKLDRRILSLLIADARMTIKDIAAKVSLSSPAVAQRIRKLEKSGIIAGYTVRLSIEQTQSNVYAIISMYVEPQDRQTFRALLQQESAVEQCYQVTGQQSHMVKVNCTDINELEELIGKLQKLSPTNTQIILSTIRGPSVMADTN